MDFEYLTHSHFGIHACENGAIMMQLDKCVEQVMSLDRAQVWELFKCFTYDTDVHSKFKRDNFKNDESWKQAIAGFIAFQTDEILFNHILNRLWETSLYFEKWRN